MKGNMNLLKKWAVVGTDFVITALNVPVVFRDIFLGFEKKKKKTR